MNLIDIEPLLNANRVLASTLDIDKLLKIVLQLAAEVVRAETGSLLILDAKTNELTFDVALGDAGKQLKTIRLKVGEGIAGWVAQERKPQIVNDPANDPRWARKADDKTKFVTRSILCVPMLYQGQLLGVVQAINKVGDGFTADDQVILESFASQTAVAIQNARLFSSLRQEKEKVDTIFSQMAEGAVFSDDRGDVMIANPAAMRLLNWSGEKGAANNLWQTLRGYTMSLSVDAILSSRGTEHLFEASRQEGKSLILAGLTKRILSDKQELIGHLTILRDVTLEKKEEKLKRDFLSLMSHKLKTPLVAITGYTPILLEDEAMLGKNPFFKKAISAIHTQGIHLKQLVEKLISFSLIEAEEMRVARKNHNAKKLIEEIVSGMKSVLEGQKVQVSLDPSLDSIPEIVVDFDMFREIMKGLIENAAKFNPKPEKKVAISAKKGDGEVVLTVSDNGRGIPSEEFEKIFQKFYQIEESFTGQVEGAGLGLALVKRLVEVHEGRITLESKMGEGSAFHVHFPSQT